MQVGSFGAVPTAAAAAWLAADGELAGRLLVGGTATWALSKLVKQVVRRPRPVALLAETRRRGREAAGLGYLSGHAGVAIALGAAALPHLSPAGRALTLSAISLVGLTRVYVGAHLPSTSRAVQPWASPSTRAWAWPDLLMEPKAAASH
jgi:glycosyltransferase 2 family protein